MNSHRLPQELTSAPYHHYHQVIEESFRPLPQTTYGYGAGPIVKVKPAPQPPERFVETLRARGIHVRVEHYRYTVLNPLRPYADEGTHDESFPVLSRVSKHARKELAFPDLIFQNGGETHVTVTLQDGRKAKGVAVCSTADLYNKRLGVYLAAKRALAALKKQDAPMVTTEGFPPPTMAHGGGQETHPANLN